MEYYRDKQNRVRKDAAEADLDFLNERALLLSVYGTRDGRTLLLKEMVDGFFFSTTFTGNAATYLKEGVRQVMLKKMELIPDLFAQVLAEHAAAEVKRFDLIRAELLKEGVSNA
jgi:hypothetical protein